MNENAKRWVRELRSGRWSQAAGVLRSEDGRHCCLGVACAMSRLGFWDGGGAYWVDDYGSELFLPRPVQQWLGLADEGGAFNGDFSLSELNDSGHSFEQIANIIEANADSLFVKDSPQESGSKNEAR
jgi:hypothetical protein